MAEPPKTTVSPSIFIVKFTAENRSSIGKDGNGVWIQDSSRDTHFILTKNNTYQIVRKSSSGQYYYSTRVGDRDVTNSVDENSTITLKRCVFNMFYISNKILYLGYIPQTKTTVHFDE